MRSVTEGTEVGKAELRRLFERGTVYADRWTGEIRSRLDVPDPLTEVVAEALGSKRSVVLAGNAGDGKSHLAQRALDQLPTRSCIEVTSDSPCPTPVPPEAIIFIRDASALSDAAVLETTAATLSAGATLLVTINEGPLSSLAHIAPSSVFPSLRDALHRRAVGDSETQDDRFLIINLAGRQLPRSDFVQGVLERLLPCVSPCGTCGKSSKTCPRVVGAKMLNKSRTARRRLGELLRLLTDGGRHLSAREIWAYAIDLFFGWTCPPGGDDVAQLAGYFWMRVFAGETRIAVEVSAQFDPVAVPMAREDVYIWQGRFDKIDADSDYPGAPPAALARENESHGLQAFESAKRCFFFFGKGLDAASILASRSPAPRFGRLVERSLTEQRPVIRELVGLINNYRLGLDTENDLWISRHHGLAAHRRPSALAATGKLPIDKLTLHVPYQRDSARYESSGFFPTKIFLAWEDSNQFLQIDFPTWQRLSEDRVLTVDRSQETLDFALDLFLSQAAIVATDDPEIHVYDHRTQEATLLRIRPEERKIEVIR